jgi:hypothetical protein
MERKHANELREHMLWSYYGLRVGLAAVALLLPIALFLVGGILHGIWLEPSISRYYHTESQFGAFSTRDIFVGGLVAAGICLYLYKGFSDKENRALNFAGIFAVLVAVLPPGLPQSDLSVVAVLHGIAAVLFFLCIAYVGLFRSRDTLDLLPPDQRVAFVRRYFWTGLAMIVSPLVAVVLSFVLEPASPFRTAIFFVETLGIWAFAAYWLVKTVEMRLSEAEKRTLHADLKRAIVHDPTAASTSRPVERIVPADSAEGIVEP